VVAPLERRSTDWDCPKCPKKFIFGIHLTCPVCKAPNPGAAKPVYERRQTDWDCPGCGKEFIFGKKDKCPDCGHVKPTKDVPVEGDGETCVVCLENKRIMMAMPCKHRHYCFACSEQLKGKPCASCRAAIESFDRVYGQGIVSLYGQCLCWLFIQPYNWPPFSMIFHT
jgi:hypothetical protein